MRRVVVHPTTTASSSSSSVLPRGLNGLSSTTAAIRYGSTTTAASGSKDTNNNNLVSTPSPHLVTTTRFGSFDVEHALTPIGALSTTPSSSTSPTAHNNISSSSSGDVVQQQQNQESNVSAYSVRYPWSPATFDKAWRENRCLLIRVYSGPIPTSDCTSASSTPSSSSVVSDVLDVAGGVMVVGIDASCSDPIFLPESSAFTSTSSTSPHSDSFDSSSTTAPSLYQQLRDYLENQRELYTPRQVSRMLINAVETDYATEMLPPGDSTARARLHRTLYGPERRILRGGKGHNNNNNIKGRDIDGETTIHNNTNTNTTTIASAAAADEAVSELFRIVITPSGSVVQGWFVGSMGTVQDEADYHKSSRSYKSSNDNSHSNTSSSVNNNANTSLGNSKLRQELLGPAVQIGDASIANTDESFAVDRMLVEESCSLLHSGYLQPDYVDTNDDVNDEKDGNKTSAAATQKHHQHQWSVEDNITRFFERKWGYQSLSMALSVLEEEAPSSSPVSASAATNATSSSTSAVQGDMSAFAKERAALERIGTLYSKWCCNNELAALSNFRIRGQTELKDFGSLENCIHPMESETSDDAVTTSSSRASNKISPLSSLGGRLESILNVEADPAGLLETADVHMIFRARQHAKLGGLSYRAAAFDVVDADGFTMYRPDIVAGKTTLVAGLRAGLTVFKDRSYGHITQLAPPLVAASAPMPPTAPDAPPSMMQPCVHCPTTVSAMLDLLQPLATSYTTAVPLQSSPLSTGGVVQYVVPAHTYLSSDARLQLLRHIPVTLNILRLTDSLQKQQKQPAATLPTKTSKSKKNSKTATPTTDATSDNNNSTTRTLLILPTPIPPQMELTTIADVLLLTFTRVLVHNGSWQRVSGSSTSFSSSSEDHTPGSAGTMGGSRPGARDIGASNPGEVGSGPKSEDGANKRGGRVPLSVTSKGDVRGGGILVGDEMDGTKNNISETNNSDATTTPMPSVLLRREPDECLSLLYHAFSHSRHRCEVGMGIGAAFTKALISSNLHPKKDDSVAIISQGIDPMTSAMAISSSTITTATTSNSTSSTPHQRDNALQIISEITADFVRVCRTGSMMLAVDMLLRQTDATNVEGTTPYMPTSTEAETATANVVKLLKRKQDETQNRRRHGGKDKDKKGGGRINSRKALANALKIMSRRQGGAGGDDSTSSTAAAMVRSKLNDCIPEEPFFEDVRTFVQEAAEWVVNSVDAPPSSLSSVNGAASFSDKLDPLVHLSSLFHNPSIVQQDVAAGLVLPEEAAQLQQNIISMLTNLKMTFLRYESAHKMVNSSSAKFDTEGDMEEDVYPSHILPTVQRAYELVDTSLSSWMKYNGTITEASTLLLLGSTTNTDTPATTTTSASSSEITVSSTSSDATSSSSSSSLTREFQDMYNFNNPWGTATNVHLGTHRAVCEMLNAPYFSHASLALSVQHYLSSISTATTDDSVLVDEASIDPLQLLAEGYSQRYLYQTVGNRTALEQALFRYRYAGSDDQYCFERAMKVLPQPMSEVLPRYRTSLLSDLPLESTNITAASGSASFFNSDGEIEDDPIVISRRADSRRAKELSSLLRGDNGDDYVDEIPKGLSQQGGALGLLADRESSGNGGDIMRARGKGSALDSPFEVSPDPLVIGGGIQFSFSGKGAVADGDVTVDTPTTDDDAASLTTQDVAVDNDIVESSTTAANNLPSNIVSIVDDIHHAASKQHRSSDLDRQRVVSLFRQLSLVSTTGRSFRWGSIADSPIVFSTPYDPVTVLSSRNHNVTSTTSTLTTTTDTTNSSTISGNTSSSTNTWYTTPSTYRRRRRILPYALTNQTFGIRQHQQQQQGTSTTTTAPIVQETAKQRLSEQVRQLLCSGVAALPQGLLVPSYSNIPDYEGESSMAASSIQSIRFPSFRVREAPALAVESVVKNVPYLLPPPMLVHHGRRENNNNTLKTQQQAAQPPSRHIPRWASTSQLGLESYVWTRRVALGFEGRYVYSTLLRVMVKEAVNNAKLGLCFKTSSVTGRTLPPEVKTAAFYNRISTPPSWATTPVPTSASTKTPDASSSSLVPYDVQSVTVLPHSTGISLSAGNHTEGWLEIKRAANALSMHSTLVVSCLVLRRLKLIPVVASSSSSTKKKSTPKKGSKDDTNTDAQYTYITMIHPSSGNTVKVRIPKPTSTTTATSSPLASMLLSSHLGTAAATIASVYKNYVPAVVTCDPLGVLGAIQTATATTPSGPVNGMRGPDHFGLVCEEIVGNVPPGTAASAVRSHQQLLHQQHGGDNNNNEAYHHEQYDDPQSSTTNNNSALLFAMTDKLQRKFEKAKKNFGSDYEDSGRGGTEPAPHSLATLPDPVRDQVDTPKANVEGWTPNIASSKSPANLSQSMTSDGMHMEAAFVVAENRQSGGLKSLKSAASALISAEDDSRLDEDFMCAPASVTEPILVAIKEANDLLYANNSSSTKIIDDADDIMYDDSIASVNGAAGGALADPVDNSSLCADRPAVDSSHLKSTANYYKGLTKIHTQRGEDGGDGDDGMGASPWSRVPKSMDVDEVYNSLDDDDETTISTPPVTTPASIPEASTTATAAPTVSTSTDHASSTSPSAVHLQHNHYDTSRDHPLERLATGLRDVVVPYEHLLQLACIETTQTSQHQLSSSPSFANGRKEMDFEQLPLNLLSTSAALDLGAFNISDFTDVARELASWMTREELAATTLQPVAPNLTKSKQPASKKKEIDVEEVVVYDLSVEEVAVVFKGAMYLPSIAHTEAQLLELLMFS